MIRTVPIAAVALLLLGAVPPASAQEAPVRSVTLEEALELFARNNLELRLSRAEAAEAAGRASQAAAYPNPRIGATYEPLSAAEQRYSERYLNLSQTIEWPGERGARIDAAEDAAAAARARLAADSIRLAFDVKRAWVEAAAAEDRLAALRRVHAVVRAVEGRGATRFASGDLSGYDLRRLRVERARYENALADAELALRTAQRRLAALILPDTAAPIGASGLPTERPPVVALDAAVAAARANRPVVRAAAADVDAARAGVRAARASRIPDPTVTGGLKRQSDELDGFHVGLSLPVPLFNRRGGAIDAAHGRLRAAGASLGLARRQAENDVRLAYDAYASLRRRAERVGDGLLAGAEDLLEIARVSYREGEMTLVELLDAAEAYRDASLARTDLRAETWIAYHDLVRAAGGAALPSNRETQDR